MKGKYKIKFRTCHEDLINSTLISKTYYLVDLKWGDKVAVRSDPVLGNGRSGLVGH